MSEDKFISNGAQANLSQVNDFAHIMPDSQLAIGKRGDQLAASAGNHHLDRPVSSIPTDSQSETSIQNMSASGVSECQTLGASPCPTLGMVDAVETELPVSDSLVQSLPPLRPVI